jgi:hypothetical protein
MDCPKMHAWLVKIAAVAVIPALIGMGAAISAPSTTEPATVSDKAFQPGDDGIDYAAVTGERTDGHSVPACADPSRRGNLRPCL